MNRGGKLWSGLIGALLALVVAGVAAAPHVATHKSVAQNIQDKCLYKVDQGTIGVRLEHIEGHLKEIKGDIKTLLKDPTP
jgi:hypothetical protein